MHVRSVSTPQRPGKCSTAAGRTRAQPGSRPTAANKMPRWEKACKRDQKWVRGVLGERSGSTLDCTEGDAEPHDEGDPEISVPRSCSHAQTEWWEGTFLKEQRCVEI